jgi:hypothetical protein
MMAMSQPVDSSPQLESHKLDRVHLASMQSISQWNSSYSSKSKVSSVIVERYYEGSRNSAEQICSDYFGLEEDYAVYASSNVSSKVCGNYDVKSEDSLVSETGFVPDVQVNGSFTGPVQLTMVIKD